MEKSFSGDLARVEVPDLLTFVNMCRRLGVLRLERPEQESSIYFREGQPIFASSNKEGLRLPDMLVRLGRLKLKALREIVDRHRATGHRIGQVLVEQGVLTEDELVSYLKVQVSEVIFDTFEWRSGGFGFYDDVAPPEHAVTIEMDIQNLIMEGVRRIDVRGRLAEVFSDHALRVELTSNPERVRQSLNLTPEEWRVFFLVDGKRSVSELCQIAGNPDELATLEILHRLLQAKMIALAAERSEAGEPPGTDLKTKQAAPAGDPKRPSLPAPVPTTSDSVRLVSPLAVDYAQAAGKLPAGRLTLLGGPRPQSFPFDGDSLALGRHPRNEVTVEGDKVSAFHARIDRTVKGFVLVDLKSTNGTFVNGARITSAVIKAGDEIRLGPVCLRFDGPEPSEPPPPRGRPGQRAR